MVNNWHTKTIQFFFSTLRNDRITKNSSSELDVLISFINDFNPNELYLYLVKHISDKAAHLIHWFERDSSVLNRLYEYASVGAKRYETSIDGLFRSDYYSFVHDEGAGMDIMQVHFHNNAAFFAKQIATKSFNLAMMMNAIYHYEECLKFALILNFRKDTGYFRKASYHAIKDTADVLKLFVKTYFNDDTELYLKPYYSRFKIIYVKILDGITEHPNLREMALNSVLELTKTYFEFTGSKRKKLAKDLFEIEYRVAEYYFISGNHKKAREHKLNAELAYYNVKKLEKNSGTLWHNYATNKLLQLDK